MLENEEENFIYQLHCYEQNEIVIIKAHYRVCHMACCRIPVTLCNCKITRPDDYNIMSTIKIFDNKR